MLVHFGETSCLSLPVAKSCHNDDDTNKNYNTDHDEHDGHCVQLGLSRLVRRVVANLLRVGIVHSVVVVFKFLIVAVLAGELEFEGCGCVI